MKKKLYLVITLLLSAAVLSLSSCLKDKRLVDFSTATPVVEFNLGGLAYFSSDAIQTPYNIDTIKFAVSVTTKTVPTTATNVKLAIDNSVITSYIAQNPGINYQVMPTNAYTISTLNVQIPANQRYAIVTMYVDMTKIDPSQSYMLPIKIVSSDPSYTVSGNMGIHYYHFIGNDFAGTYYWDYTRTPAAGNFTNGTAIISPVTPTDAEAFSGYYTGLVIYDLTFTKNSDGTYSNVQVNLNAASVASQLTANNISVTQQAVFASTGTNTLSQTPVTKAYILSHLDFIYKVLGSAGGRTVEDRFHTTTTN